MAQWPFEYAIVVLAIPFGIEIIVWATHAAFGKLYWYQDPVPEGGPTPKSEPAIKIPLLGRTMLRREA